MAQERMTKQITMTSAEYLRQQREGKVKRRGVMNKLEAAFAAEVLEPARLGQAFTDYKYESLKFRLANGAWYTPDFNCFPYTGRPMMYEVKGFVREAAMVRIKVAAEAYPMFRFVMVFKRKKSEGGGWIYRNF